MRSLLATHVAALTSSVTAIFNGTKRAALLLFSVAVLLGGGAAAVRGQSALDGFDPNANGTVRRVVVQPDGKILICGYFTTLSPNGGAPVTRNSIARLNSDGTLDTAFNPNANSSPVLFIAVQADGKILVGGNFTNIGGQPRNGIARLDAVTGLADSFNPNANDIVESIAVQADGKILVGGFFTTLSPNGGATVTRNRIARLSPDGTLDTAFDPNANGNVDAIAVQADGKILAGGGFTNIGGATRNCIARLDATTGLADSFNPNANRGVGSIVVQADGKILVGGDFNDLRTGVISIGGQVRNYIARLDATTGLADSFDPNATYSVFSIVVQADGKILVGGSFGAVGSGIGGATRDCIARLDATTGLADSFDPNVNGIAVESIAVQADGKILAGGDFTTLAPNGGAPVTRNRIARLVAGATPNALQLLLDESGPALNQAAALDSVLFLRDPFPVVDGADLFNLAVDRNTRVILFVMNLQLSPGETSSAVTVNLIDSNNQNYDLTADDVRPVPNFPFTQVIFRLPDNISVGTCVITLRVHGQSSNSGSIRFRP